MSRSRHSSGANHWQQDGPEHAAGRSKDGPLPDRATHAIMRPFVMPAYWVARAKITDPATYKKYTDRVPEIIDRYGGKILARGGRYQIMEGPETFHRFVVIEFPTLEQGVACFQSPEYQEAAAFRRAGGGIVENVIVESGDVTPR